MKKLKWWNDPDVEVLLTGIAIGALTGIVTGAYITMLLFKYGVLAV